MRLLAENWNNVELSRIIFKQSQTASNHLTLLQKISLLLLAFSLPQITRSQSCENSLTGYIQNEHSHAPLLFANIFLEENQQGALSDSTGFFQLTDICDGEYHLRISHIGCETQRLFLQIEEDTIIYVTLNHHSHHLDDVVVVGENGKPTTQALESISEATIVESANENLSNLLESITGVSSLKNGNSIAKPVVHGLYGNRITILNNGIAQNGQQWGNDHSPEIDPLVANRIAVIKGVGALEYQGSTLGSVVLVEPKKIEQEPHLHGRAGYFFELNGFGNGLNVQLQRYNPKLAWKVNGTLKKRGDQKAADYWLRNTGAEEANFAVQLERKASEQWTHELYLSTFNTSLGILRGSHVGNLTDLRQALSREVPFFTEQKFTYLLEAPFQRVHHHLLKWHTQYRFDLDRWLDFTYASQMNLRKEFDVRRSGRSEIPALNLRQFSNFFEGKYQEIFNNELQFKTGLQFNIVDNTNNPNTGILPLIPDYLSYESGTFFLFSQELSKFSWELGGRYDYIYQSVAAFSRTLPRRIIRYNNHFQNWSGAGGLAYRLAENLNLSFNLGYASRNPAVNELYSNGLHQGVSGIEVGDPDLQAEKSIKTTLSLDGEWNERLFFEGVVYYQNIQDYIYLNPQDEFRLTIRGAFPVFQYEQTDATLRGFDLSATYHLSDNLDAKIKYSYLEGRDEGNQQPLIFMPPNNASAILQYQIAKLGKLENIELELNSQYVFEQTNLLEEQDFTAVPAAYYLLGLRLAAEQSLVESTLNFYLKADNLLNVSYRNYLNRQRYFADDLGRNLVAGVNWSF